MTSLTSGLRSELDHSLLQSGGDFALFFSSIASKGLSAGTRGIDHLRKRFPTKTSAALSSVGSAAIIMEGLNTQNHFLTAAGMGIGAADVMLMIYGDPPHVEGEPDPQDAPLHLGDLIDFKNHPHESAVTAATLIGLGSQTFGGLEGEQAAFALSAAFDAAALGAVVLIRQKDADHPFSNPVSRFVHSHPTRISGALELTGLGAFAAYQLHTGTPITPESLTMLAAYSASGMFYMSANKRRIRFGPPEHIAPAPPPASGPAEENAVNLTHDGSL